ncbi:MAG: polysaccharide deacetylase family protein [Elusimicrobiota bacterium]
MTFILCYHKVDYYKAGYHGIVVKPGIFFSQMKYLYNRGYGTISLTELAAVISRKGRIPRKRFVITFDDGYENFYLYAFPVLKKFNFKATVFISAGFIGKVFAYPKQPDEKHLSENQIKELAQDVDFGAHTVTHPDLAALTRDKIAEEVINSKKIIEAITLKPVETFCYPYGKYNEEVKKVVQETGFTCACSLVHGLVSDKSDLYALPRFEFKEFAHMSLHDFLKNFNFYFRTFLGI